MLFVAALFALGCFSLGFTLRELALARRHLPSAWLPSFCILIFVITYGLPLYPGREELLLAPILFGAFVGFSWISLNRRLQQWVAVDFRPYTPWIMAALVTFGFIGLFFEPALFQLMVYSGVLIGAAYLGWTKFVRPLINQSRSPS